MGLLDSILSGETGGAIGQIAKSLGIPEGVAQQAAGALTPALSRGLERNAKKPGGLEDLLGALSGGGHEKYVDQPDVLAKPESIDDGNAILGHILGSKDVSRNVAGAASLKTGIDPSILKKVLPMLAPIVMGLIEKQMMGGGGGPNAALTGGAGSNPLSALQTAGGLGALTQYLDADKDGDVTDELLDLAKRYF